MAHVYAIDPACPPPRLEHEVHIWGVPLDRTDAPRDWLDHAERQRAARFRFERDQRRWASARAALRGILSRYVGVAPEHLRFGTASHGKPFLVSNDSPSALRFNLTHAEDLALVAVAYTEVGIDVEYTRRTIDWTTLAYEVFTARERAVPRPGLSLTFFELWTLKEAYLKGRGYGLTMPLQAFEVFEESTDGTYRVEVAPDWNDGSDWRLHRVPAGDDYTAALACAAPPKRIRLFRWSATA